ncbi:MAG: GlxA family transcriptional regulator [Rhodospirillales bacterium]
MTSSFSATVVLLRGYPLLSLGLLTEPWRLANQVAGESLASWALTTWKGKSVTAAGGEVLEVSRDSRGAGDYPEVIVLLGGEGLTRVPEKPMLTWLKKAEANGSLIAGVGAGADVLAKADLLDAGGGNVPIEAADAFKAQHQNAGLAHGRYSIFGRLAVCAGGTATLDFSLALLSQLLGYRVAERTAEAMAYRRRPSEVEALIEPATMKRADPRLLVALRSLSSLLSGEDASVKAAALRSGLSERQLLRLFHDTFELAPRRYQEALRLYRARMLLADSDLTIIVIALAVGFAGGPELSRAFQRQFKESPTDYRARMRKAG